MSLTASYMLDEVSLAKATPIKYHVSGFFSSDAGVLLLYILCIVQKQKVMLQEVISDLLTLAGRLSAGAPQLNACSAQ